jgi:hypothetical protein
MTCNYDVFAHLFPRDLLSARATFLFSDHHEKFLTPTVVGEGFLCSKCTSPCKTLDLSELFTKYGESKPRYPEE